MCRACVQLRGDVTCRVGARRSTCSLPSIADIDDDDDDNDDSIDIDIDIRQLTSGMSSNVLISTPVPLFTAGRKLGRTA